MYKKIKVSIIVPCFNEQATIEQIIKKIYSKEIFEFEVIVVDDNSSDGSKQTIEKLSQQYPNFKSIFHTSNLGKGSAIKSGLEIASREIILIQDSDLEYNPDDYENLIEPFIKYDADVVYGSRFIGGNGPKRLHFFWHQVANKILTLLTNIFTNLNMTDMETGYKLFKRKFIDPKTLNEKTFGIEPELTIKLAKQNVKFFEVPISYNGRGYVHGKKIKLKDAFIAVYCIFKYSFF